MTKLQASPGDSDSKRVEPKHPPVTAGGFDRGGFEYFYVGRKKYTAAQVVAALRAQEKAHV